MNSTSLRTASAGNRRLVLAVALLVAASRAFAQSAPASDSAASPLPSFDVAAVHLHAPIPHERSHIITAPGRFTAINQSLMGILQWAFNVPASRIVGPEWLNTTHFDIEAKAENALDTQAKYDGPAARLEKRRMVQSLLAGRFGLTYHNETRELPLYNLVISKTGPNFLASKADGTTINSGRDHLEIEGGQNTVDVLAEQLAEVLGRVVVNKTGIEGRYHITLKWTPDDQAPAVDREANAADPSEPPLFTAIQEQLGLKLEDGKGPVEVLVIDHIRMPSEN